MNDLQAVVLAQKRVAPLRTRNNGQVKFDGDFPAVEPKTSHQLGDARHSLKSFLAIDCQAHGASL